MRFLRKYKHFILLVTIPVLMLFMSNSLMNRHSHLVRGYVYSHAHPLKNGPVDKQHPFHSHTDAELLFLDLLGNIDLLIIMAVISVWPVLMMIRTIRLARPGALTVTGRLNYSLRGPPFCAL